jgi:hypothetical protein
MCIDGKESKMKVVNVVAVFAFALPAVAVAETGVNVGEVEYVGNVYGRAGIPAVRIAGPVVVRPADVTIAGREPALGETEEIVITHNRDVNEVLGRV